VPLNAWLLRLNKW